MPKKGHKWTEEQKRSRSRQYLGKGNPFFGKKHSEEDREKISKVRTGVWNGVGFPKGHKPWNKEKKGIHLSPKSEFKKGMRLPDESYRRGENHPMWKGGISGKYKNSYLEKLAGRPKPDKCEICGEKGRIFFDHCHKMNKFRGWLCSHCNFVLGHAKDNPKVLILLAKYLKKHAR